MVVMSLLGLLSGTFLSGAGIIPGRPIGQLTSLTHLTGESMWDLHVGLSLCAIALRY